MKNSRHCENWQRNAVAVAVASCFILISPAYANPFGANVVNGAVSISQQGNALNITNSPGAIINWQSFSIGASEATRFIQQSAASSVLNRVTGVDSSGILGILQSNGRVFLINPNGVLFGAGAQVDVAGLVVSTLNLSNADFLAGRYNFTAHANAGGIDNQGSLTALPGGQIYLVAPNINNSGAISSVNGDILLAAGNSVELVNANSPDMRVVIDAPDNTALNLGSIVANSGRVGIYAGLINHHGIVSADTATVGATGKVTFHATKDINLEAGSVISAKGGGRIEVLGGMQDGQLNVGGALDASAPTGGNGGFIETSAAHVRITDTARITTAAPHGKAGMWLIDPVDFTIGVDITGSDLGVALDLSNVSISNSSGVTGSNGDIFVDEAVGWSANTTLTLNAFRNIDVHKSIIATGTTSGITLTAGGMVTVQPTGAYDVEVSTLGNILITADGLTVQGGSANATPDSTPHHADATLHAGGTLDITVANGVTVQGGTASASASSYGWTGYLAQVDASANAELSATGALIIHSGSVTVQGGTAQANVGASDANVTATANALMSGDTVEIINGGSVSVRGGGAAASGTDTYGPAANGVATATTNAELSATNSLTITASDVYVQGGSSNMNASASSSGSATAMANAKMHGGTVDITTTEGGVEVRGGNLYGESSPSAQAYDNGKASISVNGDLSATGALIIHAAGDVTVAGGSGSSTQANAADSGSATAEMNALMKAATIDITATGGGAVRVTGGNGADSQAGMDWGGGIARVSANAELSATGLLTIDAADGVTVAGGDGNGRRTQAAGGGSATVDANALLHAATVDISGSGSVSVLGGSSAGAYVRGSGDAATNANAEISVTDNLTITTTGGLTVRGGDNAFASVSSGDSALATVNANAKLTAGGAMTLNVSGDVTVVGGSSAAANASGYSNGSNNTAVAQADAGILATGLLTINNAASLILDGGEGAADANRHGINTATVTTNATMQGGTLDITLNGPLEMLGGIGVSAQAHTWSGSDVGRATAHGDALLAATGALIIRQATDLTVQAGYGVGAMTSDSGDNFATASGNATVSGGSLIVQTGSLTLQGGSAQATGSGGSALLFGNAIANAGAGIAVTGNTNITVASGDMALSGGSASANGTATADTSAILSVGGTKTLNLTVGSLQINGGTVAGTGGKAAQAVFDPGAITANVGGDIMLIGGNALGAEAVMYSLGPINLTIGGATGLSLTGTSGAGTGIFPNYNQPLSPITITFTGGGSVQPFIATAGADAWIQSLYVVPTVVPPTGVPTGGLFQQAFNTVLNGSLQTAKGPELNGTLLAAGDQSGDEENPLEKKPTYTCQ